MRLTFLTTLLLLISMNLWSQAKPCNSFECAVNRALEAVVKKQYVKALEHLQSAEGYPDISGKNKNRIRWYRKQLFLSIESDRLVAIDNESIARKEKERADSLSQVALIEKTKAFQALEIAEAIKDSITIVEEKSRIAEEKRIKLIEIDDLQHLGTNASEKKNFELAIEYFTKAEEKLFDYQSDDEIISRKKIILRNEILDSKKSLLIQRNYCRQIYAGDSLFNLGWNKYALAYKNYINALKSGNDDFEAKEKIRDLNTLIGKKIKRRKNLRGESYFKLVAINAYSNHLLGNKLVGDRNLKRALRLRPSKKIIDETFGEYPSLELTRFKKNFPKWEVSYKNGFILNTGNSSSFGLNDQNNIALYTPNYLGFNFNLGLGHFISRKYSIHLFIDGIMVPFFANSNDFESQNILKIISDVGVTNKFTLFEQFSKKEEMAWLNCRGVISISSPFSELDNKTERFIVKNPSSKGPPAILKNNIKIGNNSLFLENSEIQLYSETESILCDNLEILPKVKNPSALMHLGLEFNLKPILLPVNINLNINYSFLTSKGEEGQLFNLGEEITSHIQQANEKIDSESLSEINEYYTTNCNYQVISGGDFREFYTGFRFALGFSYQF